MFSTRTIVAIGLLLPILAVADENNDLNNIYRHFFNGAVDVNETKTLYSDDIIHVGPPNASLIRGIDTFIETNIIPLNEFIDAEKLTLTGKAYIARRMIIGNMANDVGYLYMKIESPDGRSSEQVQKFSWVFTKTDDSWRVLTDFDGTPAPLSVLDQLEPQIVIE